jgi:C-terminal processing protease CtpA/Prc
MKHALFAATTLALLALPLASRAGNCKLDINPVTSGFFLNPTLDKMTVRSIRSVKPGFDCKLQQGDEIVQINTQPVPGQKAKTVQAYWKSLKPNQAVTFKVLRQGKPLTLVLAD